jgi:hypothetical protein
MTLEMSKPQSKSNPGSKYSVRVGNVYFLSRVGLSLRWATQGLAPDALAPDVRHLLARLDQLEAQELAEDGAKLTQDAAKRAPPE